MLKVEFRINLGAHEVRVAFETTSPEEAVAIIAKMIKSLVEELGFEPLAIDYYELPVGKKFLKK